MMKVETVEQFKIMQFLDKNFDLRFVKIELVFRNTIQLTDCNNDTAIFTYDEKTGKVETNYDDIY